MTTDDPGVWNAGPGLLEAIWHARGLVLLATVVVGLAGLGASLLQTVRYEASARLFLAPPGSTAVFGEVAAPTIDGPRFVRNQAERLTSRPVLEAAHELVDGRVSVEEIAESVVVESSPDLDLLTIRALDATPEEAAELANAVGAAYQQVTEREVTARAEDAIDELQRTAEDLETRIAALDDAPDSDVAARAERDAAIAQLVAVQDRIRQLAVDAGLHGSGVQLFEEAQPPRRPAQPRPVRNTATAALLGLFGSSAYAWLRAGRRRSADDSHDAAAVLGAPLLGEVPDFRAVGASGPTPVVSDPHSGAGEAYQFVLSAMEFALEKIRGRSVVVTSAGAGDGKTTTVVNLAAAVRKSGRSVLLVDGDERVRGLSRLADLNDEPGITDLADISVPVHWCVHQWEIDDGVTLSLTPAGQTVDDPAAFARTAGFRTALTRLRDRRGLLLVDAPPLLAVSDTSALAAHVDGVVLVVTRGTPLSLLEEVRARLDFVGTPLIGYVFNRGDPRRARAYESYRYTADADAGSAGPVRRLRRPGRHLQQSAS